MTKRASNEEIKNFMMDKLNFHGLWLMILLKKCSDL